MRFMKIGSNKTPVLLMKKNLNFQTSGLKAEKQNMEFRHENQINGIQFLKKTVLFEFKITSRIFGV